MKKPKINITIDKSAKNCLQKYSIIALSHSIVLVGLGKQNRANVNSKYLNFMKKLILDE